MVPDGGVAAVGERAGAPVAYAGGVVGVPAEYPRLDLGHEAAVVVADAVPYHVVAHLVAAGRVGKPRTAAASRRRGQGGRRSGRSGAAGRGGGGRSERRERRRGRKGGV